MKAETIEALAWIAAERERQIRAGADLADVADGLYVAAAGAALDGTSPRCCEYEPVEARLVELTVAAAFIVAEMERLMRIDA